MGNPFELVGRGSTVRIHHGHDLGWKAWLKGLVGTSTTSATWTSDRTWATYCDKLMALRLANSFQHWWVAWLVVMISSQVIHRNAWKTHQHLQLRIDWSRIRYHPNGSAGLRFPRPPRAGAAFNSITLVWWFGLSCYFLFTSYPAGGRRACHKRKPRHFMLRWW